MQSNHANSPNANQPALVRILRLLLDVHGGVVSGADLESITPQYPAIIEELQSCGFPIMVTPVLVASGGVTIFFDLDRNAVTGERPLAMLRCYDLICQLEALPPGVLDSALKALPPGQLERELRTCLADEDDFPWGQA